MKPADHIWLSCSGRHDRPPRDGDRAVPKADADAVTSGSKCACGHRKGHHYGWGRCVYCYCEAFCPAGVEVFTLGANPDAADAA